MEDCNRISKDKNSALFENVTAKSRFIVCGL